MLQVFGRDNGKHIPENKRRKEILNFNLEQGWPDFFVYGPNFIKILSCGPQIFSWACLIFLTQLTLISGLRLT